MCEKDSYIFFKKNFMGVGGNGEGWEGDFLSYMREI